MKKSLVALVIAASSLLYSGCGRDYKEYDIDGNKVLYSNEEPFCTVRTWDIIETKKDSTMIFYNFLELGGKVNPYFSVHNKRHYTSNDDSVYIALDNRLQYLLHNIDSIDKAKEKELIKRINE